MRRKKAFESNGKNETMVTAEINEKSWVPTKSVDYTDWDISKWYKLADPWIWLNKYHKFVCRMVSRRIVHMRNGWWRKHLVNSSECLHHRVDSLWLQATHNISGTNCDLILLNMFSTTYLLKESKFLLCLALAKWMQTKRWTGEKRSYGLCVFLCILFLENW